MKRMWGSGMDHNNSRQNQKLLKIGGEKTIRLWAVLLIYVAVATVHFLLQAYPKQLAVYPDELIYFNVARSMAEQGTISIHNLPFSFPNILYSLLLVPFFYISNIEAQLLVIELFNCFVMASVIVPAYLMTKGLLKGRLSTLSFLVVVGTLPDLMLSGTFMSEVIFYPLAVWAVYFIWRAIDAATGKQACLNLGVAGVVCYLLYWCKAIALSIVLTVILCVIAKAVFSKQNMKTAMALLGSFCIAFYVTKLAVDLLIMNGGIDSPYQIFKAESWFSDPYNVFFTVYCVIYMSLATLLAFFYFPVVWPAFSMKEMAANVREKYIFVCGCILVNIGVISYMISSVEDLGASAPRIHLRYFSPLLVPLLAIFFHCLENQTTKRRMIRSISLSVGSICCVLFFTVFRGVGFSIVDGLLLHFYNHTMVRGGVEVARGAGEVALNPRLLIVQILICATILFGTLFLLFCLHKKVTIIICCSLILCVNFANNMATSRLYSSLYKITPQQYTEAIILSHFLEEKSENILVITQDFHGVLDKYLPLDVCFVQWPAVETVAENGYVDLTQSRLTCSYPGLPYPYDRFDYIITDQAKLLSAADTGVELLHIDGVENYYVYYNSKPTYFTYLENQIFPQEVGQTKMIQPTADIFFTQMEVDSQGRFFSTQESGALVYGPYCNIYAGQYDITFYFSEQETASTESNMIGTIDVNVPSLGGVLGSTPVYSGQGSATLRGLTVAGDAGDAEARFMSNTAGVSIDIIEIKKIS